MTQTTRKTGNRPLGYPDHLNLLLEDYLAALDFGEDVAVEALSEAMKYSLLAGGKRIRPALMIATGISFGADPESLLPTAAALEMIHTYSLIHDDLPAFDDDDLRRGQPTCHIRYGENVAILAGDALFSEAFRLICEKQVAEPEVLLEVIKEIAVATGVKGMVGGQYLDVTGAPPEMPPGIETDTSGVAGSSGPEFLKLLHNLKTGRLIVACVHCGGLLAGAPAPQQAKLRVFAAELGLLFQIKDDILDVVGETAVLGKKAGADERLKRRTYVSYYGLEESQRLAKKTRDRALMALDQVGGNTEDLAGITDYIFHRQR